MVIDEDRHAFNSRQNSIYRALRAAERAFEIDPASLMASYALADEALTFHQKITRHPRRGTLLDAQL